MRLKSGRITAAGFRPLKICVVSGAAFLFPKGVSPYSGGCPELPLPEGPWEGR